MSVDDIVASKGFKYAAPSVALTFKHVSVRGLARDAEPIKASAYHTLVLANHWQPGDAAKLGAHPSQQWLELYAYEFDSKKKRREPTVHHVGQTEIEGEAKRPFDILIDSVLYGPLLRAVIKPFELPNDDGVFQLPAMSFCALSDF